MIDSIYLALSSDTTPSSIVTKENIEFQQSGLMHSKGAGRFEIVKEE